LGARGDVGRRTLLRPWRWASWQTPLARAPWQNIAHDKKQQGAAHGGTHGFTWTEPDDTALLQLKAAPAPARMKLQKRLQEARSGSLRENPAWQARRTPFTQLCLTEHVQLIAIRARRHACTFFSI
jgi:hypothetical protein